MSYFYLIVAIIADVLATSSLKACGGFTRFYPSVGVLLGYGLVLLTLCAALKVLPLGMTYAIWSGAGTIGVAIVAAIFFNEPYDGPRLIGTFLIALGTFIMYFFPKSP